MGKHIKVGVTVRRIDTVSPIATSSKVLLKAGAGFCVTSASGGITRLPWS
jgi:hypothetical protein